MRPVLVFDGDCGMCSSTARLVERRLRRSPGDFDVSPSQRLDLGALGLSPGNHTLTASVGTETRSWTVDNTLPTAPRTLSTSGRSG